MKDLKNKRGISLIVLIITIIVMIILAAAIILSISNSGIIDKANKAKQDSDTANLKEYVNILEAEWEMMTTEERGNITKTEYINNGLNAKGYEDKTYSADGEIYSNLSTKVKDVIKKGLKIGDKVTGYVVAEYSTNTLGIENTAYDYSEVGDTIQEAIKAKTDFEWIFIGISSDGKLKITPDFSDENLSIKDDNKMTLSGKGGFNNGASELNRMCGELYSVDGVGEAASMNMEDVIDILGYTGGKGYYTITDREQKTTEIYTEEPSTLGELEESVQKFGHSISPDSKVSYKTYKANAYKIQKNAQNLKYKDRVDLVFPNSSNKYWLSSSCVNVGFNYFLVTFSYDFCMRCVNSSEVGYNTYFTDQEVSLGSEYYGKLALRPVVEINPDVSVSYSNGTLTLN